MRNPQPPLAIASLVFDNDGANCLRNVLRALPYSSLKPNVCIEFFGKSHGIEEAVSDVLGSQGSLLELSSEDFSDSIIITYKEKLGCASPSSTISIGAIGRFFSVPVITVAWGSDRKDRDLQCDDVFLHYKLIAEGVGCCSSVLAIEQQILQIKEKIVFTVRSVCAITFGRECARSGESSFDLVVNKIRQGIRKIGEIPCVVD